MLRVLNWLLNGAIATAAFLMVGSLLNRWISGPAWLSSVALCLLSLALYVANGLLIGRYIQNRAPEYANVHDWERTAGTDGVPRWVSLLGLLALPSLLAAAIWTISWYW